MAAAAAPQTGTAYKLRLGDSVLGKRKADEALYLLKTQFKPQSAGTFRAGNLQLDAPAHQVRLLVPSRILLCIHDASCPSHSINIQHITE